MFKKLNAKLEYLFDHGTTHKLALDHSLLEAKNNFVSVDRASLLENLSYVYNGEVNAEQLQSLFAQTACYFEINFLFKRISKTSHYQARSAIFFGKEIKNIDVWPKVKLPPLPLSKVYKTSAVGFLKKFDLAELDNEKKMTAFLFRLSSDLVLLVATDAAEPWAKLKIESLHQTLMKINFGE